MLGVAQLFLTNGSWFWITCKHYYLPQTMLQILEKLSSNDSPINEILSCSAPKHILIPKWEGAWYCSCKQVIEGSSGDFSAEPIQNQLKLLQHSIASKLISATEMEHTRLQWYFRTEESEGISKQGSIQHQLAISTFILYTWTGAWEMGPFSTIQT